MSAVFRPITRTSERALPISRNFESESDFGAFSDGGHRGKKPRQPLVWKNSRSTIAEISMMTKTSRRTPSAPGDRLQTPLARGTFRCSVLLLTALWLSACALLPSHSAEYWGRRDSSTSASKTPRCVGAGVEQKPGLTGGDANCPTRGFRLFTMSLW